MVVSRVTEVAIVGFGMVLREWWGGGRVVRAGGDVVAADLRRY